MINAELKDSSYRLRRNSYVSLVKQLYWRRILEQFNLKLENIQMRFEMTVNTQAPGFFKYNVCIIYEEFEYIL